MIDELLTDVDNSDIHTIRDVTRGGLSAVLHEFAGNIKKDMVFYHDKLPLLLETVMAAYMLGINPINLANEECICLFVDPSEEENVLEILRKNKYGKNAVTIGYVLEKNNYNVIMIDENGN